LRATIASEPARDCACSGAQCIASRPRAGVADARVRATTPRWNPAHASRHRHDFLLRDSPGTGWSVRRGTAAAAADPREPRGGVRSRSALARAVRTLCQRPAARRLWPFVEAAGHPRLGAHRARHADQPYCGSERDRPRHGAGDGARCLWSTASELHAGSHHDDPRRARHGAAQFRSVCACTGCRSPDGS
jgi:hypothetical protein